MPAYLVVYGATPADRLAAYAYPDRKTAWAASVSRLVPRVPPTGPAGGCAYIIETAADVTFNGRQLVDVYNGLAPTAGHVNRFENRTIGVQRLLALLTTIVQPPPTEKDEPMPDDTITRGRRTKYFAPDTVISTVGPNPYREGSKRYAAYALYQPGMTAAQFLAAGGKPYDLNRAMRDGYVDIS